MEMGHAGESVGVRITDVQAVGNYGLNLAFSDGQDRGIYPWAYLRQLASIFDPADCEAQ